MGVGRGSQPQRLLQGDVLRGVHEVLLAAEHVGDAHVVVVDDVGEVECWEPVGLLDDEIFELVGGEDDLAEDEVVDSDVGVGHSEPHDAGGGRRRGSFGRSTAGG